MFPLMEAEGESLGLQRISGTKTFDSGGQLSSSQPHKGQEKAPFPWLPQLCWQRGLLETKEEQSGLLFKTPGNSHCPLLLLLTGWPSPL